MKRLVLVMVLFASSVAYGQDPAPQTDPFAAITPTPTAEMWFYAQEMKRYDSPKEMVRRNAEFRAAERRSRIARAKWMGHSKARPTAEHTPFTSSYTPRWISEPLNPVYWLQGRFSTYSAANYHDSNMR